MSVLNFTVTNKFNNLNINANGTDVGPLSDKQPIQTLLGDTSLVPKMVIEIKDLKNVVKKSQIIPSIGINSDVQYDIVIKQEIPNEKWTLEFYEIKSSKEISTQSDRTNEKSESDNSTDGGILMTASSTNTVNVTVPPDEPPTGPSALSLMTMAESGALSAVTTVYLVLFVIFMYGFGGSETAMDIFAIILLIVDIAAFVAYLKTKMENTTVNPE
jgi:hypothetical protein